MNKFTNIVSIGSSPIILCSKQNIKYTKNTCFEGLGDFGPGGTMADGGPRTFGETACNGTETGRGLPGTGENERVGEGAAMRAALFGEVGVLV